MEEKVVVPKVAPLKESDHVIKDYTSNITREVKEDVSINNHPHQFQAHQKQPVHKNLNITTPMKPSNEILTAQLRSVQHPINKYFPQIKGIIDKLQNNEDFSINQSTQQKKKYLQDVFEKMMIEKEKQICRLYQQKEHALILQNQQLRLDCEQKEETIKYLLNQAEKGQPGNKKKGGKHQNK